MFSAILFLLFFSFPYTEACVKATTPPAPSTVPFVTVPPSCTSCNGNTIAPILTDSETTYELSDSVSNSCKITTLTCKRTDNEICDSVRIEASSSIVAGKVLLAYTYNSNTMSVDLKCAADGTYTKGALTGINQMHCDFVNCKVPLAEYEV